MDIIEYQVVIDVTFKEGRFFLNIKLPKEQPELNLGQVRGILMSALALTIRGSEDEADAMKNVINYLNDEFVNVDSFNDVEILVKK
mgnify:CR=1 FL=1|jgi:hypothetical protein